MPPPFKGQDAWDGMVQHSSQHVSGANWAGKRALVVGACTSAHDICVDMAKNGVDVTMLQRSPTFVMTVENGMNLMVSGLYNESTPSIDLADKIAEANPKFVVKLFHKRITEQLQVLDREVLDGLAAAGFKTWKGPDDSGFIMMALDKAGGYYHSTGGSEAIARGDIKVRQGEIASFDPNRTVAFKDGSTDTFDVVVFATGYTGFPDMVRDTLGEGYARTFAPVWGLDAEGEIQGVARESNIPNMFFSVGALAPARLTSKVIALQIIQQRAGVFGERYTYAKQLEESGIALKQANGH
jgi:cation diffusion facilitator CzcD-associated flavoprotein CzcO